MMIRTPAWDEMRRKGIGGSEAAAAMGLSRWKTRLRLWQEKRRVIEQEDISDQGNVFWGVQLEPLIAREYARRTNHVIRRRKMCRSRRYPWMVANVDSHVIPRTLRLIVEIKTINAFAFNHSDYGADGTDKVPVEYYAQAQHNMVVTDSLQCDMPVLIGGQDFRLYRIPRNEEFCNSMILIETNFWLSVQNGTEPEPVNLDDLLLKFPGHVPGKVVEATPAVVRAYAIWQKHDKSCTYHDSICKNQILTMQKFMQDAETLMANGAKIATWKKGEKSRRFLPVRPKNVEAEQADATAETTPKKSNAFRQDLSQPDGAAVM
jgi:putative phage-type endonuclease